MDVELVEPKFDNLIANGTAASKKEDAEKAINDMLNSTEWEKTETGGGNFKYSVILENTSSYDFKGISILVNLFDADNVKHETHASASSWKKGERIKFDAWGDKVDAQRIEAVAQHFTVDN